MTLQEWIASIKDEMSRVLDDMWPDTLDELVVEAAEDLDCEADEIYDTIYESL